MTLTEFLLARIAEDELWAREATPAPWDAYADGMVIGVGQNRVAENVPSWNQRHIARHDPARVLAECERDRRIVKIHGSEMLGLCQEDGGLFPCRTLDALALPYADHPDYNEAS